MAYVVLFLFVALALGGLKLLVVIGTRVNSTPVNVLCVIAAVVWIALMVVGGFFAVLDVQCSQGGPGDCLG